MVEDGQTVTVTLGSQYTAEVGISAVTISAVGLQALTDGQTYTLTKWWCWNVVQVTSSQFTVDTSVPSINAIGTDKFSWGAVLNAEDNAMVQ